MKITLNWLKRHIKFHREVHVMELLKEIETECIKSGMELDGIEFINPILQVKVLQVDDIPGMRVRKCFVNLKPFETITSQPNIVLCGGSNARSGMYTLMCPLGTTLPNGLQILERKIKNETSYGMLLSATEANVNLPCEDGCILDLETEEEKIYSYDDVVLTFKVPFHRWDLHCARGIARSLGAIGNFLPLKNNWKTDFKWNIPVKNQTNIVMTFGEVKNIKITNDIAIFMKRIDKFSMQQLQMLNDFVLMDIGHPIAIYDIKYVDEIYIKENHQKTISIENSHEKICEGGIKNIRGYESDTTHVVIEAGYFHKENINTLKTDSAYRFWLGIDNEQMTMEYVYSLIDGEKSSIHYCSGIMPLSRVINLPLSEIYRYTSLSISGEEVINILSSRGFVCNMKQIAGDVNDTICVECKCPSWRKDILLPVDILEEITRAIGYDKIQTNEKLLKIPGVNMDFINQIKLQLCAMGFNEIYKFPFTSKESYVQIRNPIAAHESFMREDLFESMQSSININEWSNKFFTYDTIYSKNGEEKCLGILLSGRSKRFWNHESMKYDFFTLKQVLMSLNIFLNTVKDTSLPEFAAYGIKFKQGYLVKIKNSIAEDTYFAQVKIEEVDSVAKLEDENFYTDISIKSKSSWADIASHLTEYNCYLFDMFPCDGYIKYGITFINSQPPMEILRKFVIE